MIKAIKNMPLIGLEIEITDSKNKSLIGLTGKIIDETQNTIKIQTGEKTKTIIKDNITIQTKYHDQKIKIKGNLLKGRPSEKTK